MIRNEMLECFILGFGLEVPDEGRGRPTGLMPLWSAVSQKCGDCTVDEVLDALYNLNRQHAELNKFVLLDGNYQAVSFERKRATPSWKDFFYGDPFRIKVLPAGRVRFQTLMAKSNRMKARFAVGTNVRVRLPGINGVVAQLDEEPASLGEYWHTIQTKFGVRREPGSNLELVPKPISEVASGPGNVTEIHLHGHNSRLNFNSTDNSTNIAATDQLYFRMREEARLIADTKERDEILARLDDLEKACQSGGYVEAYQNFIASVANHITVFGPFIPALSQMLSGQ